MTTPLPKRYGKTLPPIISPDGRVCFTIQVPDELEYRAALNGVIGSLGEWFTWEHYQTDYVNPPERNKEAAQVWINALAEAIWEECMTFCEDMIANADCFLTDESVKSQIDGMIDSKVPVPATYPPGLPNPIPTGNLAGTSNPGCDLNILWAQCLALTSNTNAAIIDVLQKIEVTTNSVELIDAATEFPLVGWAKDALGGQITLDLIQYYQEAIDEEYQAQYTETVGGVRDQLACALFCLCKPDCEITIDRLYNLYKSRLEVYMSVPSLDGMLNLIEFVAGTAQDTTIVVDLAFFFAWGSAKLGSFFFGKLFDTGLDLLLRLAVNDANNDWEALCTDCEPPPPTDLWVTTTCIGETRYGVIEKISGPESGVGTYSFRFTGVQFAPPSSIYIGGFRWGNTGQQFVVNSFSVNQPFPEAGTGYYFPPASDADCGYEPGLVATFPTPDSTTFYGGIKANTNPGYPWIVTMNITVSDI